MHGLVDMDQSETTQGSSCGGKPIRAPNRFAQWYQPKSRNIIQLHTSLTYSHPHYGHDIPPISRIVRSEELAASEIDHRSVSTTLRVYVQTKGF